MKSFGCDSKRSFERIHFLYISLINGIIHIDVRIPIFYSVCVCVVHTYLFHFSVDVETEKVRNDDPASFKLYIYNSFSEIIIFFVLLSCMYSLLSSLNVSHLVKKVLINVQMVTVNQHMHCQCTLSNIYSSNIFCWIRQCARVDSITLISDCRYLSNDQCDIFFASHFPFLFICSRKCQFLRHYYRTQFQMTNVYV